MGRTLKGAWRGRLSRTANAGLGDHARRAGMEDAPLKFITVDDIAESTWDEEMNED